MPNLLEQYKELLEIGAISNDEYQKLVAQQNLKLVSDKNTKPNVVYGQQLGEETYSSGHQNDAKSATVSTPKKRTVAAVLALLIGTTGAHKFYLGYTTPGVIMLIATIATLPLVYFPVVPIFAIVEGVIYLTKNDEEFNEIYVENKREWL